MRFILLLWDGGGIPVTRINRIKLIGNRTMRFATRRCVFYPVMEGDGKNQVKEERNDGLAWL